MENVKTVVIILLVIAACGALLFYWAANREVTEVTEIERKIAPSLLKDDSGQPIESPYAEQITFANPSIRVNPQDDDELLIELDVRNAGDKTVKLLHIWADFYNRDGQKAADEGELLAHDIGLGDNSSPVPPRSGKRAIIELDSPESWRGGKMVITIIGLEIE
ncbi:MAG: hypothetical protein HQ581_06460 [Planctomycetes bacterium]|nr:hypothetical protein [Planctomycetota bacterium]